MISKRSELIVEMLSANGMVKYWTSQLESILSKLDHAVDCPSCAQYIPALRGELSDATEKLTEATKELRKIRSEYEVLTYFRPIKRTQGFGRTSGKEEFYGLN